MTNAAELPPLHVAELDRAGLLALIADIEHVAQLSNITLKRATARYSENETPSLHDAVRAVIDGSASGLQLRYLYEGQTWWDTILRTEAGFRVIRISPEHAITHAPHQRPNVAR